MEINSQIIDIHKLILEKRKKLGIIISIFLAFGIFIAFTSEKEYKIEIVLLPEAQSLNTPSILQDLAGLGGINLSGMFNQEAVITPELYAEITSSTPFLLSILNEPVYFNTIDSTTTYFKYLTGLKPKSFVDYLKEYTIDLPWTILRLFKNEKKLIELPKDNSGNIIMDEKLSIMLEQLKNRITVFLDPKTGLINITIIMPDNTACAEIGTAVIENLNRFIVEYNTEKTRKRYEFIKEQREKAELEYEKSLDKLSEFQDKNLNIITAKQKSIENKLQSDYNLAFNLYNSLILQEQQARISIEDSKPNFNILEPVKIPEKKFKPKRLIIMVISLLFGLFFGIGYIVFIPKIKEIVRLTRIN